MLYFIPSWYEDNSFYNQVLSWYEKRMHTEIDDTLKHVQLMHRNLVYPSKILLMSYMPHLREFLHRHGIYKASYWSCFDALQGVPSANAKPLSYLQLDWPDDVEFLFSNFNVSVLSSSKVIGIVQFSEDGHLAFVDRYDGQVRTQREMYDDRGFLSSILVYKDGKPSHRDLYAASGLWKLRHYLDNDVVEINPMSAIFTFFDEDGTKEHALKYQRYESMEALLHEVLEAYIAEQTQSDDLFVVATHEMHEKLIQQVLQDKHIILTFFEDRYPIKQCDPNLLLCAKKLVADTEENAKALCEVALGMEDKIVRISPYDTGKEAHLSTDIPGRNILVAVDGLEDARFVSLIRQLVAFANKNKNVRVQLLTRYGLNREYIKLVERVEQTVSGASNLLKVVQAVEEIDCIKCMRDQRLFVDLREQPEAYLQMLALSIGVPQIVMTQSPMIEHNANGVVLDDIEQIQHAFLKYLGKIARWNEARVCSLEIAESYLSGALESQWREVVENIE